ncbi:Tfp pilus assembly protein tip-associated adhesin PilY1-like protein [Verminephrobacter eiseniae EF01-2]|uniref:Tfp pilus assembly protein tip-associated adhesin PilY1-like protein n=3 Tax=Verminephrobacter eiseniae TaxID=364317 RepID=A1WF81_VEREI|nr:Tfp pilus assembly protein tip-associated adhesin PilY1-like protein [Verminephrobacter eiseniae EF01-2]
MMNKTMTIHHMYQRTMKTSDNIKSSLLLAIMFSSMNLSAAPVHADVEVSKPVIAIPPNIVAIAKKPMVMLTASKDHLLFGPVYTDFEDLDDDGVIDTTFKPTFEYYGYFDARKCYAYDNDAGQFNPAAMAIQTSVTVGSATATKYSCSPRESHWSGNFLNWTTMTRLDIVRKMLYGGYRVLDINGSTVLMGAKLVEDSHSFVKYYNGTDVRDYTPFDQAMLTRPATDDSANAGYYAGLSICLTGNADDYEMSQPVMRLVKGNVRFWSTVNWEACRWIEEDREGAGTFGPKLSRAYSSANAGDGKIGDRPVHHEASLPSMARSGATYSGIGPQLNVRVKVCDPARLGAERCQAFPPHSVTNFKPYGLLQEFGHPKTAGDAARAEFGLITGSYDNYNEDGHIRGAAGALRKNMGDLEDEINRTTGVFCHNSGSGCPATLPDGRATGVGAIKTFDTMSLYGRRTRGYQSNTAWLNPLGEMLAQTLQYYAYNGTTPVPSNPAVTAADSSAGMPVATWRDPFIDSSARRARYGNAVCRPLNALAISSSTLSYDGQAASPFSSLPNSNAGLDFFVNKIGQAEGIHGTARSVGSVPGNDEKSCSAKTVQQLSDVRGICPEAPALEGSYQIAGVALYGNTKPIRDLGSHRPADLDRVENALKVKTMAVSLSGGAPRIDVPVPAPPVADSTANPSDPPSLLNPRRYITITPESVHSGGKPNAPLVFASISSSPTHGAFLVAWNDQFLAADYDMDVVGFLRYDLIRNVNSPSGWDIRVRTDISNLCSSLGGTYGFSIIGVQKRDAANNLVNADGRYLTHQYGNAEGEEFEGQIYWDDYTEAWGQLRDMPPTSQYLCGDASYRRKTLLTDASVDYAHSVCYVADNYCEARNMDYFHDETFHVAGEANALIKEPLWYVGKYGSFKSSVENTDGTYSTLLMPPTQNNHSWDSVRTDGSVGQDGVPDGYFLARRPELLEAQLRTALHAAAKSLNSAPAIASAQLTGGSRKFVARFSETTVSGELEAYEVDAEGEFQATPVWQAGAMLKERTRLSSGNDRAIITNDGNGRAAGVGFRWADLPEDYRKKMTEQGTNQLSEANAQLALNYIRGDHSREDPNGLRQRADSLLGPVVNATPWIQGPPGPVLAGFRSADERIGYSAFFSAHKDRAKLIWLAANDGMLHAFNPDTGAEVFAYVPGALANRLAEIPLQRGAATRTKLEGSNFVTGPERHPPGGTVWAYVDGHPFSADVMVGDDWKTYVFGTLGRGGKGIFALDATVVADLTESNAASVFKWQFTSTDDEDLGHITGEVSVHAASNQATPVVRMNNGKYALLLGNGYKSMPSTAPGKAVLYVLFVDGPNDEGSWTGRYTKIVADAGPGNGLSMPRWEDIDGNGTADVAYAGDLKGNLWKFDLQSDRPNEWQVALKEGTVNKPLYTASDAITTAPQIMYMGKGGFMVNFATGNAFETHDFPKLGVPQRIYGIWDRPSFVGTRPIRTDTLALRAYTRNQDGKVIGAADAPALDWSRHNGWYMDLPNPGEAVLSNPTLESGVLSFVTVRPKAADTGSTASCFSSPLAALYTVDPISGKTERNLQGSITLNDTQVFVTAREIGDQKVRLAHDRTQKAFTKNCQAGQAGCTCTGSTCTKAAICGPGQRAKRVIGSSADAVLCMSNPAPRLQWREVSGLGRTDQP